MLVPETQKEHELIGEKADAIKGQVAETAQTAVEHGKQVAQEVAGQVQESAQEAAGTVKEQAQQVAQDAKETAQSTAQEHASQVKDEAQSNAQTAAHGMSYVKSCHQMQEHAGSALPPLVAVQTPAQFDEPHDGKGQFRG